jgi:fatty-acyl-CoA synthase
MTAEETTTPGTSTNWPKESRTGDSASRAWLRALERTAPIPEQPERIFPRVIDEMAARLGDAPALLSDRESFSYRELAARANQYARWALSHGLAQGGTICLLMPNRPEYLAIWLGITHVGGIVALLNTHLSGAALAHSISTVRPSHILLSAEMTDTVAEALSHLAVPPAVWVHGEGASTSSSQVDLDRIDRHIEQYSGDPLLDAELPAVTIADGALYIYTSGTTGLPKAAKVSHARIMQWSHWFAGMLDLTPADRLFNCLPMYHSVGGVLAPGAILAAGGSLVTAEKFSVTQFWNEIIRWDCTLFQYIGELCRYLLHSTASYPPGRSHRLRAACGNGLRPDVWGKFKERFQIPRILEFYAATEGGVSLFNAEEKIGAIGRVPAYLQHRFSPALVRFDFEKEQPLRDERGFCMRCETNEAGEALGPFSSDPSGIGSRFEGYSSENASGAKILRDVFVPGDAWIRTGDLMRRDEKGFYYFVDRLGDTFRWKGENVATVEVAETIGALPGVRQASVYGVTLPGADGRAGMALLVTEPDFDLASLRMHLVRSLPAYARPLFLRLRHEMELTGTFKYTKTNLIREGYDPAQTPDPVYFHDPEREAFVRVDPALYARLQAGEIRL